MFQQLVNVRLLHTITTATHLGAEKHASNMQSVKYHHGPEPVLVSMHGGVYQLLG